MERIKIALSISDRDGCFCRHLGVTVKSVIDSSAKELIDFYILHDNTITKENKNKLEKLFKTDNQRLIFVDMRKYISSTSLKNSQIQNLTIATLYRLLIPKIFPQIDKMIYLDTDILCNINIKQLWDEDISDYAMGVVKDSITYLSKAKTNSFYKKIHMDLDKYFNAGVLLMNLDFIREHCDLFTESMSLLSNSCKNAPCLDQDVLNIIFKDKCKFIDSKYNLIADDVFGGYEKIGNSCDDWNNKLWHFAGPEKPWLSKKYPVFILYWRTLSKTPWGDTPDLLLKWMYMIEGEPLENELLNRRIAGRKKFLKNIFLRLIIELKKFLKTK